MIKRNKDIGYTVLPTDNERHRACWAALSREGNDDIECLVCGEWRSNCAGCPWELEENKEK